MKGIINEVCLESVRETIIKLLKKKNRQQNELQKETGKGKGTIQYHLRILKERGYIEIEKNRTKEAGQPLTIKLSDKLKKIYESSEDYDIKMRVAFLDFLKRHPNASMDDWDDYAEKNNMIHYVENSAEFRCQEDELVEVYFKILPKGEEYLKTHEKGAPKKLEDEK